MSTSLHCDRSKIKLRCRSVHDQQCRQWRWRWVSKYWSVVVRSVLKSARVAVLSVLTTASFPTSHFYHLLSLLWVVSQFLSFIPRPQVEWVAHLRHVHPWHTSSRAALPFHLLSQREERCKGGTFTMDNWDKMMSMCVHKHKTQLVYMYLNVYVFRTAWMLV